MNSSLSDLSKNANLIKDMSQEQRKRVIPQQNCKTDTAQYTIISLQNNKNKEGTGDRKEPN